MNDGSTFTSYYGFRVATHQRVKTFLTFHWPLNTFHGPFIDKEQSRFTFALALFAGQLYFSVDFQTLSVFRGERKKEFDTRRVSNWSLCLLCSILFIFSDRKFMTFTHSGNSEFSLEFYKMKFGKFASIDLGHVVWVWGFRDMYMGEPRNHLHNSSQFSTDIHDTNLLEIKT